MAIDWDKSYRELTHLIATMPALDGSELSVDDHLWLGRAYAAIGEVGVGHGMDAVTFASATNYMATANWPTNAAQIRACVFRAYGVAERQVPSAVAGRFIPVKSPFEALVSVSRVLELAKSDVLVVDAYMDMKFLDSYAKAVPEGVAMRILADSAKRKRKATLKPAVEAWRKEYEDRRPLEARLSPEEDLHDRYIILDGDKVFWLSQSFNGLAEKSPALLEVLTGEMAVDARASMEAVWARSQAMT